MAKPKVKYQHLTFSITALGQEFPIDFETDKLYDTVTGINILLSDDNAKFSTIQMEINSTEVFPENFEIVRIKFREQVPNGYDYHTLSEPAGGSKVKGKYTDKAGASYPYTVSISFRLENICSPTSGARPS